MYAVKRGQSLFQQGSQSGSLSGSTCSHAPRSGFHTFVASSTLLRNLSFIGHPCVEEQCDAEAVELRITRLSDNGVPDVDVWVLCEPLGDDLSKLETLLVLRGAEHLYSRKWHD